MIMFKVAKSPRPSLAPPLAFAEPTSLARTPTVYKYMPHGQWRSVSTLWHIHTTPWLSFIAGRNNSVASGCGPLGCVRSGTRTHAGALFAGMRARGWSRGTPRVLRGLHVHAPGDSHPRAVPPLPERTHRGMAAQHFHSIGDPAHRSHGPRPCAGITRYLLD